VVVIAWVASISQDLQVWRAQRDSNPRETRFRRPVLYPTELWARVEPLPGSVMVAVRADDLTFCCLGENRVRVKPVTFADIEELYAADMVELHDPRRILDSTVGARNRLQFLKQFPHERCAFAI
jgi:hypothetical protein